MLIRLLPVALAAVISSSCGTAPKLSQLSADDTEQESAAAELKAEGIVYDYFDADKAKKKQIDGLYAQYLKSGVIMLKYDGEKCIACKRMAKPVASVAKKLAGKVLIVKVDVVKAKAEPKTFTDLPKRIPEMQILINGKPMEDGKFTGMAKAEDIEKKLQAALKELESSADAAAENSEES